VLNLTVTAVRDMMACELYFQLRHLEKESEPVDQRTILARRFENTMRRVASYYFFQRQQGFTPSYNALLKRWERVWFPKKYDAYDIAVEQHAGTMGNYSSYTSLAAVALLRFVDDFGTPESGDPIAIDEPFIAPVAPELRLEGRFDLVLRKAREHHVVVWTMARKPDVSHHGIDFAAQRFAYERARGRDWKDVTITYWLYSLSSAHTGLLAAEPGADDVAQLLYWARRAGETETYVPRRGYTTYCKNCVFDSICRDWKKWPR
jgi:hypothetical protein